MGVGLADLKVSEFCVQDYMLGATPDADVGVAVRGHLWEVDLLKRRLKCSYWPDSQHRVVRGTWYIDRGSGYAPLKVGRRCPGRAPLAVVVHPSPILSKFTDTAMGSRPACGTLEVHRRC